MMNTFLLVIAGCALGVCLAMLQRKLTHRLISKTVDAIIEDIKKGSHD